MLRATAEKRRRWCVELAEVLGLLQVSDRTAPEALIVERIMRDLAAEVDGATVEGRPGSEIPFPPVDDPRQREALRHARSRA